MLRDFYETLGVARDATPEQIKKAYRRLAHKYHPDKNPDDESAEERFKEASYAYEVLSDPETRRKYDRFGRRAFQQGGFKSGGFGFGDVFSEIFGDFFGRRQTRKRSKGRDRVFKLKVDFRSAVLGGEKTIEVPRNERCTACTGTGSRPGTSPQICHACGGSGEIRVQQGVLSVAKKCTYCRGRGKIITKPCTACGGSGHNERVAQLRVRIPAGSDNETVLRYGGEGEPARGGGTPGDLRVLLEVEPHPIFERNGDDLQCTVPVSVADAALGAQLDVPTLDGSVRMTVPAGTQSGSVFRLRGRGVPHLKGEGRGDQHVTVVVETPQNLARHERELFEALRRFDDDEHYPRRAELRAKAERQS